MTYVPENYKNYDVFGIRHSRNFLHEKTVHLTAFILAFMLDLSALMLAYSISLPLLGYISRFFPIPVSENVYATAEIHEVVYFCLSMAILFFLYIRGHYSRRIPWWSQIQDISKITVFALLVDVFANYALELGCPLIFIVTSWLTAFSMFVIVRMVMNKIKCNWEGWRVPAAIIADPDTAMDALYALASDRGMGLAARAIFLRNRNASVMDREELPEAYRNIDILTGNDNYEDYILRHPNLFYIISLESVEGEHRDRLVSFLHRHNIQFALLPTLLHTGTYQSEPHYFFGNDFMLLNSKKPAAPALGRLLKRSIDIAGASIALAIFIVPMLLVALMLKLEGQGGSPLYAGWRVGQNGRLFRCWKFRSMEPGTDHLLHEYLEKNPQAKAHWDRYFKLPDDPRVQTRTARFIRRASIDELPQVWNVLKGDMSLVGPRPILESEIPAYGNRISEYNSVKPGITGLWQASGRNGTSFQRRVSWDSWYVRNWTLWGDIIIILKTIQVVLSRSGAS